MSTSSRPHRSRKPLTCPSALKLGLILMLAVSVGRDRVECTAAAPSSSPKKPQEAFEPFGASSLAGASDGSAYARGSDQARVNTNPETAVLLDTTEQSSLGWTKYPDAQQQPQRPGWSEESFTNFERGINWRSIVVCDVAYASVNNWLWTPFIERGDASRLYIEIKFTMRDCNLFPQMVLSCKETFALLYKETDEPITPTTTSGGSGSASPSGSSSSINNSINQDNSSALWSSAGSAAANASFAHADTFTLIDAIAADEGRFTSSTDVVINTELRSIPVSKRGVHFAFRDQGACLSLISVKVYALKCPELSSALATFPATPTGRDLTSLVAVEGRCVENSVQVEQPRMFCGSDGRWNAMSSGQCKCLPGFEPAANGTRCEPCGARVVHSTSGPVSTSGCTLCPANSVAASSPATGALECRCADKFFRAPRDSRAAPCTQPPSAPTHLSAQYVDSTSVVLTWQAPKYLGGRPNDPADLVYRLGCDQCDSLATVSSPPLYLANFSETKCVLSGLQPQTSYHFIVYAMNAVSAQSGQPAAYAELSVQTSRQQVPSAGNTLVSTSTAIPLPIFNFRALQGARPSDIVLAWDTIGTAASPDGSLLLAPVLAQLGAAETGSGASDQPAALFEVRYQARAPLMAADGGAAGQVARRSPYPMSAMGPQQPSQLAGSVTTTNRALALTSLAPRTEYAFQIRASRAGLWTDWSEAILASTPSALPAPALDRSRMSPAASTASFGFVGAAHQTDDSFLLRDPNLQQQSSASSSSWLNTLATSFVCALGALALAALALLQYRKSSSSPCGQFARHAFGPVPGLHVGVHAGSASAFGGGGAAAAYAGVYNGGASSDLMGVLSGAGSAHSGGSSSAGSAGGAGAGPFGIASTLLPGAQVHSNLEQHGYPTQQQQQHRRGNVVQNFIAATLGSIANSAGGNCNHHHHHHHQHQHHSTMAPQHAPGSHQNLVTGSEHRTTTVLGSSQKLFGGGGGQHQHSNNGAATMDLSGGKLFAALPTGGRSAALTSGGSLVVSSSTSPVGSAQASELAAQRNLYHQMQQVSGPTQRRNPPPPSIHYGDDLMHKYRTLQGAAAAPDSLDQQRHQIQANRQVYSAHQQQASYAEPALHHIYDDLDTATAPTQLVDHHQQQPQPAFRSNMLGPTANGTTAPAAAQVDSSSSSSQVMRRLWAKELDGATSRVSIESVIGRGAFGDICLGSIRSGSNGDDAADEPQQTQVALKMLNGSSAQLDERTKLEFLVEAILLSQFEHANVTRLDALWMQNEPPMIVTEFMENGQLDYYLRDRKQQQHFGPQQLISMVRGIANGMQYLSSLGFVHKDLAARNILVDRHNVCKISGFANGAYIASAPTGSDSAHSRTASGTKDTGSDPFGPPTMSVSQQLARLLPAAEQLALDRFAGASAADCKRRADSPTASRCPLAAEHTDKESIGFKIPVRWTALEAIAFRRFTCASDVWSFGIVCWEIMSHGERPYWNWSNQDVIKAVEQGYRLPQPENCPDQLYRLMLDCWLKERLARPTFTHIVRLIDAMQPPPTHNYDDPFSLHQRRQPDNLYE